MFAFLTCASGLAAQRTPSPDQNRLRTLFSGLPVGENIQLVTPEIILEDARLISLEGSTVQLEQVGTGIPIVVDLTAIRGVSVQRRHGTLWGTSTGLLAGSIFGLMIGSFNCTTVDRCRADERAGAVRLGTTLALVGGGIGFALGRRDVYWYPIFP